jgi:hypothetical protein
MSHVICFKCSRHIEPLTRREIDKKAKKTWLITYCPYERCNANLDIEPAIPVKIWNQKRGFFQDETDPE